MNKKRVFGLFLAVALIFGFAAPGMALYPGFYGVAVLVPYATYGGGVDTSIGLTLQTPPAAGSTNKIYWSFLDADGVQITSGAIDLLGGATDYGFSLAGRAGGLGSGETGYLVFTFDGDGILTDADTTVNIVGNAFIVNLTQNDAAYIPVVSLIRSDFKAGNINLLAFPADGLEAPLWYGTYQSTNFRCRYLIDPTGDPRTRIVIFTPGDALTTYSASIVSSTGSTNNTLEITPTNKKLNVVDVQSIAPAGFVTTGADGSVSIANDAGFSIGHIFVLTYWSLVGAEQTLICGESF